MVEEKPVEEDFVGILQRAQIDMPLQVIVLSLVRLVRAHHLLIEGLDLRRQQSVQAKLASLLFGERRAFVQQRAVEEIHPGWEIL